MSAATSKRDPFAALLGTGRGLGGATCWPRYAPPPPSSAPEVRSLADFERRMRPGVVGVVDRLDQDGQVTERSRCVVEYGREYRCRWWSARLLDNVGQHRSHFATNFPDRASDCRFEGPSLRYDYWRFTVVDESGAEPPAPKPDKGKPMTAAAWRAIEADLRTRAPFPALHV